MGLLDRAPVGNLVPGRLVRAEPSRMSDRALHARGARATCSTPRREHAEQIQPLLAVPPLPSLDALYRSHGPAVLRRARQLLGSDEAARDVLQDVFTSLLGRPEQFEGRSSPMTFLYSMTTNCALGRLRQSRTRGRLLAVHHDHEEEPGTSGPEALVQLRHWFASLPDELADVAVYYHLDDMTQDEIADVLGCSRQRVGKLLARLRDFGFEREPGEAQGGGA